jgi:hypothetical protein
VSLRSFSCSVDAVIRKHHSVVRTTISQLPVSMVGSDKLSVICQQFSAFLIWTENIPTEGINFALITIQINVKYCHLLKKTFGFFLNIYFTATNYVFHNISIVFR